LPALPAKRLTDSSQLRCPESDDVIDARMLAHPLEEVNPRKVEDVIAAMDDGRAAALDLVTFNRGLIDKLALALDRCGRLDGSDVERIVGYVLPGPTREESLRACERRDQRIIEILEAQERKNAVAAAHSSTPSDRAVCRSPDACDATLQWSFVTLSGAATARTVDAQK
jgi:hypothetical protein